MSKRKILISLMILLSSFAINTKVNAAKTTGLTVKENQMFTDELGLNNVQYNTRKGNGSLSRQTKFIGGFKIGDGTGSSCSSTSGADTGGCENARWFCVEPGTPLESGNKISGAWITNTRPSTSDNWTWDVTAADEKQLSKVLSCWYGDNYSIIATQIIAWEIVTEERYDLLSDKILSGTYKPYLKDGSSTFGAQSGITSLYELIANTGSGAGKLTNSTNRNKLYKAYKETLECAARFDKTPSKSYTSQATAKSNAIQISNYDDATQTFSTTISDSLLNYYTITNKDGLSVSLNNGKLTISTKSEITKANAKTIQLDYYYITKSGVDGKSHSLRNDGDVKYLVKTRNASQGKNPQAMARGSATKTVYISFYTGTKPKYQIKLKKTDDSNPAKAMSNIEFYVCSADNIKSGQKCNNSNKITTIKTNASGEATYTEIPKIGQYVAQEVSAPAGYVIDSTPATFNVIASNKKGTNSYANGSRTFVNKKMHLKMLKRTLDDNGKVIDLPNDICPKSTCPTGGKNGPVFTITSEGKKLCVTRAATNSNQYTFAGLRDTCQTGETDEIETCNGAFDIELIPAGTYVVTETTAPCGMTLPSNNHQTVVVKPNTPVTTVTMLNGVTGVVFTKVTEDGTLLSGGKFALQMKKNGIYEDMLLVHKAGAVYEYSANATTETEGATYLLETQEGIINVTKLPKGEYRMVEKEAPEGYDLIREKDSTATVTISDASKSTDYYQIKLVNQKTLIEGSSDDAEIVVTIKTGRNVINYPIVIGAIVIVLVGAIIIRKKMKK